MSNFEKWDQRRGKIISKKGGWRVGSGVESHGYDLINELVGHYSYMQVVVLNATGKMPSRKLADWLEAIHICLSWPDPRIWCNRVGALGGSAKASPIASVCSGTMAADSKSYGIRPLVEGVSFITGALKEISRRNISVEGYIEEEISRRGGKPFFMGYARPLAKGDERIGAMEGVTKKLGFEIGPHLELAYEIEKVLLLKFDETMNINGYGSAFMADQDISAVEIYRVCSVLVASGVAASYVDNIDEEAGLFSPLRVSDISYEGKKSRSLHKV